MANDYRNSMEDLRYSFHKSLTPIKARIMMMMKLLIFTIIAIKALIFVTAAVLTVACFATKMINNLDVDDGSWLWNNNNSKF